MRFDILTIFPEMFTSVIGASIQKRAQDAGILSYHVHNIRDYSLDKHRKTDDYPFGGGNGLVMLCQPVFDCIKSVKAECEDEPYCIMMTPRGRQLTPEIARALSQKKRLLILCGHYEGIDERVSELMDDEISTGDYVLTGGELPAMTLCDCVSRFIPGVLGTDESADDESFSLYDGLLEYPQYTRPAEFEGRCVPDVLLGGNHADIEAWRHEQSIIKTAQMRPDIINRLRESGLSDEDYALAMRYTAGVTLNEMPIARIEVDEKRRLRVYPSEQTENFADVFGKTGDVHYHDAGYFYATGYKKSECAYRRIITAVQVHYGIILKQDENTVFEKVSDKLIKKIKGD